MTISVVGRHKDLIRSKGTTDPKSVSYSTWVILAQVDGNAIYHYDILTFQTAFKSCPKLAIFIPPTGGSQTLTKLAWSEYFNSKNYLTDAIHVLNQFNAVPIDTPAKIIYDPVRVLFENQDVL